MKYNTKAIVTLPGWASDMIDGAENGGVDTINSAAMAYAYVPLVYRAVRLRCDALSRAPINITSTSGNVEKEFPFEVDMRDLIWKSEAALCLHGANYIEKILRTKSGKVDRLQWVNPTTMSTSLVKTSDGAIDYIFRQGVGASWNLDGMIYMREFSLRDDVGPGDAAAKVSLNDAALIRYMSRFAARFFETGAMPVTILQIDGIVDSDEANRIKNFFKRAGARIKNAWNVIALGRGVEPKVISQPLKDLVIPELNSQARHAVSLAFGIPQTMLEDAANFATADSHRMSFWQDTIMPRGEWMAEQFNKQLLNKMGLKMAFAFEEMDIFQEDETARANSLKTLVDANVKLEVAMSILGYDLSDEEKAIQFAKESKPVPPVVAPAPEPPAKNMAVERWKRKAIRVYEESGSAVCAFDSDDVPPSLRAKIEAGLPQCKSVEDVKALFTVNTKDNPDAYAVVMAIAEALKQ